MEKARIVEWVDIDAPRSEVYQLVLDVQRRMQLSPLWGVTCVEWKSADYPSVGSRYRVKIQNGDQRGYETVVTGVMPERKFTYSLQVNRETCVSWTLQDTPRGTRLTYEEEFLLENSDEETFNQTVREVVRRWLNNLKRYAELRKGRLDRLIKWFLNRYFLKLRPDQRMVIATLLFMQIVGTISFVMAAIALGVARLL